MNIDNMIRKEYDDRDCWGMSTAISLHECNHDTISNPDMIYKFVVELCKAIDMKRYGEPQIVRFGSDPNVTGYSLVQLIETSLISAHFAENVNSAYIDIFSCKYYRPYYMANWCNKFFEGNPKYEIQICHRLK